ncbi:hypothetical protein RB195_010789 [Necator americanus]|uniref:Peptidase A2 domain-containing protein n=1 Tax=Necator americanus TaxID=51031 RepID=A0ABR1CZS9_NECAM
MPRLQTLWTTENSAKISRSRRSGVRSRSDNLSTASPSLRLMLTSPVRTRLDTGADVTLPSTANWTAMGRLKP